MFYDHDEYADLIASGRVRTWADGFGRWHACVPATMVAPMVVARGAIWFELRERETTTGGRIPPRPTVVLVESTETHKTYAET